MNVKVGFGLRRKFPCLAANRKSFEDGTNPDRNAPFEIINAQATTFLKQGCPVISVVAKKKELIGPVSGNTARQSLFLDKY